MKNSVRRSALSAAAAVAALGLVAGCGSGSAAEDTTSGGKSAEKPGEKKADAPVVKALSKAELEKLALEQGDVEGFTIEKAASGDVAPAPAGSTIEPADCTPYEGLVMNTAPGEPASVAVRTATEKVADNVGDTDGDGDLSLEELEDFDDAMDDALDSATVRVGIAGYDGDGASAAMAELRSWTAACQDGFAVGDQKQGVEDVQKDAPAAGTDEAVTFIMTVGVKGEQSPMSKWAVYRDGNTVVSFMVMNLAAMAGERANDEWGVPKSVLDAQLAKLG